jgi:hypothetical protein
VAVAVAVAGLAAVQRLVPLPIREEHNAATGIIYAALYVMFGVTVGFSLYLVWQQHDAAQKSAESEAATVEELHGLAGGFPVPERGRVQDLATSYARVVVEKEWPLMQEGRTSARGGANRGVASEHPGLPARHAERAGAPEPGAGATGRP